LVHRVHGCVQASSGAVSDGPNLRHQVKFSDDNPTLPVSGYDHLSNTVGPHGGKSRLRILDEGSAVLETVNLSTSPPYP
jgi:hypothetical protein